MEHKTVEVEVPAGAVAEPSVDITVGEALGDVSTTTGNAVLGVPVRVEHETELAAPVRLSWATDGLTDAQLSAAVLVRWDEELLIWQPSAEDVTVSDGVLSAAVQQFSIVTWLTGGAASQSVGEFFGTRSDGPTCNAAPLHDWVRSTVDPDEGQPNAAMRVCFEPDRDEIITVRATSNRTFSQLMTLTAGERYEWRWNGDDSFDAPAAVWHAASTVLNNDTTMLLPPGVDVAVGVARPSETASSYYTAQASVDWRTVTADLLAAGVDQLSIGGLNNPVLNAFVQVLYECVGGRVALGGGSPDFTTVAGLIAGCAGEIDRSDSDFGRAFEKLSRDQIAKGGVSQADAIKANRAVRVLAQWAKVLVAAQALTYLSDQIANASVGPLSWGVYGRPRSGELGRWVATCTDVLTDSTRLFQNIALQDEFADTSRELHEFPGWSTAGAIAVGPLRECPADYIQRFAGEFPATWADPVAAAVLAGSLTRWVISAAGIGPLKLGASVDEFERFVDPPKRECAARADPSIAPNAWAVGRQGFEVMEGLKILGEAAADAPITSSGVTLGSSAQELRERGATAAPWGGGPDYALYTWTEDDGAQMTAVADPDDRIFGLGVGQATFYIDC